jgi:hypothetical protein
VAQCGCGGSVGMWWLSGEWMLSGDVVAPWYIRGDVVAQLAKDTGSYQSATQQSPVRSRLPPQSPEGRQE